MWFQYGAFHEDLKKQPGMTFADICKRVEISENGLRNGLKNRTITINIMEKCCQIINQHPKKYFHDDDGHSYSIVSETELVQFYKKKDHDIDKIMQMRETEVQFLKGEINHYRELLAGKEEEIERLRKKLSDQKG